MATTTNYFTQLKTQLNASAEAKKAALDAALLRATTANVDSSGNITYNKDAAGNELYGSLDVGYKEGQRNLRSGAEGSGMLRSGQLKRSELTNEASYRANVLGAKEKTTAEKTDVTNEMANQLAEYQAMYGTISGTGGGATTTKPSSTSSTISDIKASPIPSFSTERTSVITTGANGKAASSAANFRMVEESQKKIPIPKPPTKAAVVAKPPVATGKAQSAAAARAAAAARKKTAAAVSKKTVVVPVPKKPSPKKPVPAGNKYYR